MYIRMHDFPEDGRIATRKTKVRRCAMLLFVMCYLPVAIIFLIMGTFQLRRMRSEAHLSDEITRSGSPIRGTIIDHIVRTQGQGRRGFYAVSYQYQQNGQLYDGEQEVSHEHFVLLTDGEDVDLCYLEREPAISILSGEDRDDARVRRYRSAALVQFGLALVCIILLLISLTFAH
jgi:hypothetical protein